ncbi:hypothetical protein HELRODRAFT_178530 [Helobdella robusta]|uniref:DUF7041 domain-containing protein n=1 Tax=Helobdella robusta TaxID=6412 RepID=T1FDB6_HELRO|nr:hypothetical protein HELRODRAFT_178530 [Helobdella robusta]ESN97082.1 hypothetical protein HELRODRAFT_178530 [Helobdella robusta]
MFNVYMFNSIELSKIIRHVTILMPYPLYPCSNFPPRFCAFMSQGDRSSCMTKLLDKLKCRLNELKEHVNMEFERNPYLVIFLGTVCIFSSLPLVGFIIFAVFSTMVFLAIFLIAEGVLLACSLLFFVGASMLMLIVGCFAAVLVTISYLGYKQIGKKYEDARGKIKTKTMFQPNDDPIAILPLFKKTASTDWFENSEMQFQLRNVMCKTTRFYHVIISLPLDIVSNLSLKVQRGTDYDALKAELLSTFKQTKPEPFQEKES